MNEKQRARVFKTYRLLKHGYSEPITDAARLSEETITLAAEYVSEKRK
jgi:hypothetical protein